MKQNIDIKEVKADVFSEIQTKSNCISVWEIESEDEIDEVLLALVSVYRSLDVINLLLISKVELESSCFTIRKTPQNAITNYGEFTNRHYDVAELNYEILGSFALCMIEHYNKRSLNSYTKDHVAKVLVAAIIEGKIDFRNLDKNMRTELSAWVICHKRESGFDELSGELQRIFIEYHEKSKMKPCAKSRTCTNHVNV